MSNELPKRQVSFKQSFEDKWFALDAIPEDVNDRKNLIRRADIQRNMASCTFHESIKLKHPSASTCRILQSDLLPLERLVHRSGQEPLIDSTVAPSHLLMDDCLKMLDKFCPNGSYMQLKNKTWEVNMNLDRVKAYQLNCQGLFLGCSEDEMTDADTKHLFNKPTVSKTIESGVKSTIPSDLSIEPSCSSDKLFPLFNKSKGNHNTSQHISTTKYATQNSNCIPSGQHENYKQPNTSFNEFKSRNKWASFQNSQSDEYGPDIDEESPTTPIFPVKPPMKRRLESYPINVEENPTSDTNLFKTGREILHQQLKIKHGCIPRQSENTTNVSESYPQAVSTKKSLGGRRNVQSKFVPPFLKSNAETEPQTPQIEDVEMVDERLKHIDPKMVELIKSEIMDNASTRVDWSDIAGLDYAKATIKEAVVWPLLRPDIFTGLRRPPRGILLFGPPGTGKTLIGKCIASQSKSTFFSISASSLTSKWIGDGEKMVRALFAVAAVYQPAVVFIDEIDSLLCQRSDTEHECSRRMKTEFLVQLDGAATADDERILIVGATNRPQELDEAARRRLVKRLYIPLPEFGARTQILHNLLSKERTTIVKSEIEALGRLTDGFSGADMKTLCHEASMGPIRSISMDDMEHIDLNDVRPVCYRDFEVALDRVRSSVSPEDLSQYLRWDRTYGSGCGVK